MQGMRKSGALASLEDEGGVSLMTPEPPRCKKAELGGERMGRREELEMWEADDDVNKSSTGAAAAAAAIAATLQGSH